MFHTGLAMPNWYRFLASVSVLAIILWSGPGFSEDPPLTRNVPMQDFQNRLEDVKPYDFNAPPEGIFYSIQFTEGFEEELGFRRANEYVPVSPTDVFSPDAPAVYIVFRVYPHYESFQIFGRCLPENVPGLDPQRIVAEDVVYLALEDETGYLKLLKPKDGWKPGRYKVEIHVGWKVNEVSLVGTMRFTVQPNDVTQGQTSESKMN